MFLSTRGGENIGVPISDAHRAEFAAIVLKAGVGTEKVQLGATREQVIEAFGLPQTVSLSDLYYVDRGLQIDLDRDGKVREIWGVVPRSGGSDGNAFAGASDRGIKINSTFAELKEAHGAPDVAAEVPADAAKNIDARWQVDYVGQGIHFEMAGDKVEAIGVFRAGEKLGH